MSKLSFRARALDAAKPMAVFMAHELPDLPDFTIINRAVPQMPTGMEKEEETEHHLQRAIVAGLIIPTPEVFTVEDVGCYSRCYPGDWKVPRNLIHMQRTHLISSYHKLIVAITDVVDVSQHSLWSKTFQTTTWIRKMKDG